MIEVKLTCNGCERTASVKSYFTLTRVGTLRVEGYADGWYVDGRGALCPDCKPADPPAVQSEPWDEYDRRSVIAELIREGEPTIIEAEDDQVALASLLRERFGL